jgi:hypothetical protein
MIVVALEAIKTGASKLYNHNKGGIKLYQKALLNEKAIPDSRDCSCLANHNVLILVLKAQLFCKHHFAQVIQCVTHTAQGGINAYISNVGYFFEAHIAKVAHN